MLQRSYTHDTMALNKANTETSTGLDDACDCASHALHTLHTSISTHQHKDNHKRWLACMHLVYKLIHMLINAHTPTTTNAI
eukprot:m.355791 g.355791  ORF g.355791 m.355791 type:complete len:81 (-) comp17338_c0_seq1:867-1109(-)